MESDSKNDFKDVWPKLQGVIADYLGKVNSFDNYACANSVKIIKKRLMDYVDKIITSNQEMNLIGKGTLRQIWHRHILDAVQLVRCLPPLLISANAKGIKVDTLNNRKNTHFGQSIIIDIGSGNGIPGIPLAIITNFQTVLAEKSPLKCQFLQQVVKVTKIKAKVSQIDILSADFIELIHGLAGVNETEKSVIFVSRAFKDLVKICNIIYTCALPYAKLVTLKGKNYKEEIEAASQYFSFVCKEVRSLTGEGVVLDISNISKKK